MKLKIDSSKILGITVTVLGIAGTVLSSIVDKNNQSKMKEELKEEILKDLTDQKS